ncbi:MAG TPA: aminotransferase class I/II-fold pyridoxal phosphate-dependent enzyme [Solirubrobacterales bacterium]|nr:aminotransferase class I/II-fold pyridoxal phosphate-dependent enzyme [Solirubrobacterales bacterium]
MTEHPRGFASDNFAGAHPDVLDAIAAANDGHVPAYGDDPYTAAAERRLRDHFGDDTRPFLVFNGSAANVLSLIAVARPFEAVVCPETAHMNVDECGAPERIAGVKLYTVAAPGGKLTPALVDARLRSIRIGDQHAAQPRVVSISNATELGTVYAPAETRALAELAHERGMLLHVDGARLANAAACLDVPLRDLATDAGADVVSFGGTKNGLVLGEAVVFCDPALADGFEYVRKQSLQLASKMRFVAAQLDALLRDDLWRRNASHANAMAGRLAHAVKEIPGVRITERVESNAVFAIIPVAARERLLAAWPGELPFHLWNADSGEVRWMTAWDTTEQDVDEFAAAIAAAVAGR